MVYVYSRAPELLENKEFEEKWGVLYELISTKRKSALFFLIYYYMQKVIFFLVVFFIPSLPV